MCSTCRVMGAGAGRRPSITARVKSAVVAASMMVGTRGKLVSGPTCASCTHCATPSFTSTMRGVRRASATGSPSVPRSSSAAVSNRSKVVAMEAAYSGWV